MRLVAGLLLLAVGANAQAKKGTTVGDYHISKNGKCPTGFDFMSEASVDECTHASKTLKLLDKAASWTSSPNIPLGCAAYNSGTRIGLSVYFAPLGTNSTRYSYYSAICKKTSAKTCKCPGGTPDFKNCPKNGATKCLKCNAMNVLNKGKTACAPKYVSKDSEKIYMVSHSGVCPKGYSFMASNVKECAEAFKATGLKPRGPYQTTSRNYPKGCSFYRAGNRGYYAGEGRTDYDYKGNGAYKAVCKKDGAKGVNSCVCNHGEAPHGKACKKNGAKACTKCYAYHKLNKAKTSCDAFASGNYIFSKVGTCPSTHTFMSGGKSECEHAAKELKLRDKTAYSTTSTTIPKGCSYYYGNSLYFAAKGTTMYTSSYYHAICKKKGAKSCVCANGDPAVGNKCPKDKALACQACKTGYRLSNDKRNCNEIKGDYKVSTNGKCPSTHVFLEGGKGECEAAAKALGVKDSDGKAYHTSSTGVPRGCSFYTSGALYWAPLGTKTYRYTYYKAICKHKSAKACVCKGGHASHGKNCPKNKELKCDSCFQGFKLSKSKKNCDKPTTKAYIWSNNGKCPKGFAPLTTNMAECNKAAGLLYLKDKTSRAYKSGSVPAGCHQYTSGTYADLRFNSVGRPSTATYYRAVCKSTGGKLCKCPNGTPSHGSACSGDGKAGCAKCNGAYELDKGKTKCTHIKSDYTYSTNGKCPSTHIFLEGGQKECEAAAKQLKLKDVTAYGTSSTGIPRGCSIYRDTSLYFAPRGTKTYRYTYYKAVCKKKTANHCVCPNGTPTHGKDCKKNKDQSCMGCDSGFKVASNKKTCEKITSKEWELSRNGKCVQQAHVADSIKTCETAAKALGLKDTKARAYSSTTQPKGCYLYQSGSYHDLRYNKLGRTTGTSTLYKAICHHKDVNKCKCANGNPAMGKTCPKNGQAKCVNCNSFNALNKAKTACTKIKDQDYTLSGNGQCPKGFVFLEGGAKECEYAAAKIGSPDTTAYGTASTGIPRGCSFYYGGSLYFAPSGTKTYRSRYYQAICKHTGAKQCVCPHGSPTHGNKCPKNKDQACASCAMTYTLSKDKKTCIKVNPWKYWLSNNGKCPKTAAGGKKFVNAKEGSKACSAAAKALSLPDTTARTYTNTAQPTGCYLYKSGTYHDLRYNSKGKTTSTSKFYLAVCLNTAKQLSMACKADLDANKVVDIEDLLGVLGVYGQSCTKANACMKGNKADLDGNKKIDIEDLLKILGQYGKKC